jgi:hypothetical protein
VLLRRGLGRRRCGDRSRRSRMLAPRRRVLAAGRVRLRGCKMTEGCKLKERQDEGEY